jgi:hypothetical protein
VFFTLPDWALALVILGIVLAGCAFGVALGAVPGERSTSLREPLGVIQGAILGVVGLILAFSLSLAIGRYENRRSAVLDDANAIATAYLRSEALAEPERSPSLVLLRRYAALDLQLSLEVPNSAAMKRTSSDQLLIQRRLWRLAGSALVAPRPIVPSYVDSLNSMFDQQRARLSALNDRVPTAVLVLELVAAAAALALLGLFVTVHGRGYPALAVAAALLTAVLLVTFDLDRPTRGVITVPTAPLRALQTMMAQPPAANGP